MKATKRLISLFAGMILSAVSMAEVVYEPMIVASGFNRDCIAETEHIGYEDGCAWSPLYDLTSSNKHTSCFGTRSVIAAKNANQGFTDADYAKTIAGGWPDDNGNPDDRVIRCSSEYLADAINNPTFANVYWRLAPYDGPNVLTLRPGDPDSDTKGWHASGTLTFQKIGCYDQLFFLMASLRQGSAVGTRKVTTVVHYTDGTTSNQEFFFAGLGGEVGQRVQITNIYEDNFRKNTAKDNNLAYVSVFPMDVNPNKLIQSIEFTNNITNTSAIIFAVTGRTADIAAPDEESTEVENIQNHQFTISWDGVPEAETYRVDVATDEDFQNMVGDYNNLEVSKNDTVVYGLEEDEDYYWRVRAVNADGGQSASSAPRRVRTAGNNPPETSETSENIEEMLAGYAGYRAVVPQLKIHRSLCRNGYFNTLCLPFSMNAEQIAASPLAGIRVFEYVSAEKHDGLDIVISGPIDHIDAGVPYLVNWEPTSPEWIGTGEDGLVFENVNITTYKGDTIGNNDEVQFIGNIGIANLVELDQNNLFLGANNTLYYPEGGNRLKGFRSYFEIPSSGAQAVARHTPARIVTRKETPTGIESGYGLPVTGYRKMLIDGQVIILRDGKRYNVLGVEL